LKPIKDILSKNIRKFREGASLSQDELAERSGLSKRTYVGIELGDSWPQLSNLEAIAKALGVPVNALFLDPDLSAAQFSPQAALAVLKEYIDEMEKCRLSGGQKNHVVDDLVKLSSDDQQVVHKEIKRRLGGPVSQELPTKIGKRRPS
jgi:transcriptional regulator with XRE-family HTH domain